MAMWVCPRCNEPNEEQFTACWKCAPVDEEALRAVPLPPAPPSNNPLPAIFGVAPLIEAAAPEPVIPVSAEGHVRCPTCGDIFKVREP
jgi:hypothetical protein